MKFSVSYDKFLSILGQSNGYSTYTIKFLWIHQWDWNFVHLTEILTSNIGF